MTQLHRLSRFIVATAALALPSALYSQGFGLNEIGTCALGRAFANTGGPCKDASTVYWNPAATTIVPGFNVTVGAAAIAIKSKFSQDTTGRFWDADEPSAIIVPHVFLTYRKAASKWSLGLGAYVPYGLTSRWTDDFPGRFSAKKAALQTIYVQPNIAYQLTSKWSIGGGPIIGRSSVELIRAIDLSTLPTPTAGVTFGNLGIATRTEFARVRLKGDAMAYGAQIGVFGQITPEWTVGARFLTPIEFKYTDADATFTPVSTGLVLGGTIPGTAFTAGTPVDALVASQFTTGGRFVSQKVSTKITHPAQIQAGVGYSGYKNWQLNADYAWIGWKRFGTLPLTFADPALSSTLLENYNNSSAVRLAAEYSMPTTGWQLRAGFAAVASAAPPETVTPLLPEQDRSYYTLGAGHSLFGSWGFDAGYARVQTAGARGRIGERTSVTQTAAQVNTGKYDLSANVFSLTLKGSF